MERPCSTLVLPVLGVPVRFDTDAPGLRRAVEDAFGAWRRLDVGGHARAAPDTREPHIGLRLARAGSKPPARAEARVETRPGGRILLVDPGRVAGRATLARMRADVRVTAEGLDDPRSLPEALDTLTLFLLTRLDRQPVHAAAIASEGRGLVLAGPSGVGKSTLAYAALRAGLRVLTDDAVYVQLRPRPRVWGLGRPLHLVADATEWFPELQARPVLRRAGGKRKRSVALHAPAGEAGGPGVLERVGLCVLERGGGAPAVEVIAAEEAVATLVSTLDPGFDAFRDTIAPRLRALAAGGAWRVRVGERPAEALPWLMGLLGRVGA